MAAQIEPITLPWLDCAKRHSCDSNACTQHKEITAQAIVLNYKAIDGLIAGGNPQQSLSLTVDLPGKSRDLGTREDISSPPPTVVDADRPLTKILNSELAKHAYSYTAKGTQAEKVERVKIGVVPIDPVTMTGAVDRVSKHLAAQSGHQFIVTGANAQFVNTAENDPELASFLQSADLNVADGVSLLLAARILGAKLPERVTGIDLMVELCGLAAETSRSVYLFGGMEGAAEGAATLLKGKYPNLKIVGVDRPPVGREFDPLVVSGVRKRIIEARPDFLFVCLGMPRQEKWIRQFSPGLPVSVIMGNGAAFDVLAGFFHRPPMWIQNIGLEWFYRLCMEPKRLWRRYLLGNILFAEHILAQGLALTWRSS
jgi:N-acetylglucosaminyldiphosphoundecaprenol N-acetyl-beta-D-mannosaminyltransferase